ncbi:MAG: hypothetical protein AB8G99_13150, partial [Planctomycetaceae bacterium]
CCTVGDKDNIVGFADRHETGGVRNAPPDVIDRPLKALLPSVRYPNEYGDNESAGKHYRQANLGFTLHVHSGHDVQFRTNLTGSP